MDNIAWYDKHNTNEMNLFFSDGGEIKHYIPAGVSLIEWTDTIHIYGYLPECERLIGFQNGENMAVTRSMGRRDRYHEEDAVFLFESCRVERMWTDHPVAIGPTEASRLVLNLIIKADIRYVPKEKTK